MLSTLVITLIGPDRPGLVEAVASVVAEKGGNWLESRMCHLGGQFAGLVRIEIPTEGLAALRAALEGLSTRGLQVSFQAADGSGGASSPGRSAVIEIVGNDRPGIVRQISGALARRGVNVEELSTDCSSAPMSGTPIFRARISVLIPDAVPHGEVRAELEHIASDLMVDLEFNEKA